MIFLPDAGLLQAVNLLTGDFNSHLFAMLFRDNYSPNPADTEADWAAHECNFPGYARKLVTGWIMPVVFGNRAESTADFITWIAGAIVVPQEVWAIGYIFDCCLPMWFVSCSDAPKTLSLPGDSVTTEPIFAFRNQVVP